MLYPLHAMVKLAHLQAALIVDTRELVKLMFSELLT